MQSSVLCTLGQCTLPLEPVEPLGQDTLAWEPGGPLDQVTLPWEPGEPLGQDTPSWEPEAGPSPGPGASTNLFLELLATLGAEGPACHPTRQMRKTDLEARSYLGALNGSSKACMGAPP